MSTAPKSSYDVVVVGATVGGMAAAALLARRGFRVSVIGHGARDETYTWNNLSLRRSLSAFSVLGTPAFRKVIAELALVPAVKRSVETLSPAFQVCMPAHRIDAWAEPEKLVAELVREFAEVPRPIEDFHAFVTRWSAALDTWLADERELSPEGFFARRAEARRIAALPFSRDALGGDLFSAFADGHPFRTFIAAQTRFASALDPDTMTALRVTRLYASGLRACFLDGGLDRLRALFAERVMLHGGELRLRDHAEHLEFRRGRVVGARIAGLDEVIGAKFVLVATEASEALRVAGELPVAQWAQHGTVSPRYHRFVVNLALDRHGVPEGMARRVFSVLDPARPLAEENLLALERSLPDADGRVVITAEALLPRAAVDEGEAYLRRVRARVVAAVESLVPFLRRHLFAIDSPHDGLPLEDFVAGTQEQPDARRGRGAEAMVTLDTVTDGAYLGLAGAPLRSGATGLFLVGPQVVPGLGLEGEFLAALTAARIVTQQDRSKARLRTELWSKVDW